jgi:hypothetical protein
MAPTDATGGGGKPNYFRWNSQADAILADGYREGTEASVLSIRIGCSVGAARNRAQVLKLAHRSMNRSLRERFMEFVYPEPNSGCWLWGGSVDRNGYGQIRIRQKGLGSLRFATHISLELAARPLPTGLLACHSCDFPPCVNPDHLFAGTQMDNVHDSMAKGRNRPPPPSVKGSRPLKEACVNGHVFASDGVYLRPDGSRACRMCRLEFKRRRRAHFASLGLTSRGTPKGESHATAR